MHNPRCLLTVLTACLILAGCSDTRKPRRQMGAQLDEARRLYTHATNAMAEPPYLDKTHNQVSPIYQALTKEQVDVPASAPADKTLVLQKLDEAQKLIEQALADLTVVPPGQRAGAQQLLGQVELARGLYYSDQAQAQRGAAGQLRHKALSLGDILRDNAGLADLGKVLAGLPKDKLKSLRDKAAQDLATTDSAIKAIDAKIAQFKTENNGLDKDGKTLTAQAQDARRRSEAGSDAQGLPPLEEAAKLEAKVNEAAGKMALNQAAIESLAVDKTLRQEEQKVYQAKVAILDQRMTSLDKDSQASADLGKQAQDRAAENWQEIQKLLEQLVAVNRQMAAHEKSALAAFAASAGAFVKAEGAVKEEISAAQAISAAGPSREAVEGQAAEEHLASIISGQAMARLDEADLRSRQAGSAEANAVLADSLAAVAKRAGRQPPPEIDALKKDYLGDPAKTADQALEGYKAAEAALERLLSQHMRSPEARNVLWIYQGQLASAYVGHNKLRPDPAVIAKARDFVEQALKNKEQSPYLASVAELKKLVESSGAGPTTAPTAD